MTICLREWLIAGQMPTSRNLHPGSSKNADCVLHCFLITAL